MVGETIDVVAGRSSGLEGSELRTQGLKIREFRGDVGSIRLGQ